MTIVERVFPQGSKRRALMTTVLREFRLLPSKHGWEYTRWAANIEAGRRELVDQTKLGKRPLISVVVPCFNTPEKYLRPMVHSVVGQLYENWELILVDASSEERSSQQIADCKEIDTRIKVFSRQNKGIAANTNEGIEQAKGDYVAFLDHDDLLSDDALYHVAFAINQHPAVGLIYSDEDKISEKGVRRSDPHFKPDWSPDLLTYVNYITHFLVIRKDLINKVGGLNPEYDGAQDYDLVLKIADLKPEIVHIPRILYHWRLAATSTAQNFGVKPKVRQAGVEALKDHLKRNGLKGDIRALENKPGFYQVRYAVQKSTKVSVVINQPTEPMAAKLLATLKESTDLAGLDAEFVKSAEEASGDILVFVNEQVVPCDKDWLRDIVGVASIGRVGAVAPLLLTKDCAAITDCGLVMAHGGLAPLFSGSWADSHTLFGDTDWTRDVDALSGKVFAIRKEN